MGLFEKYLTGRDSRAVVLLLVTVGNYGFGFGHNCMIIIRCQTMSQCQKISLSKGNKVGSLTENTDIREITWYPFQWKCDRGLHIHKVLHLYNFVSS